VARSKRDPLKALTRQFPELHESYVMLSAQSDRSMAIVSAALIDASLERLLIRGFPHLNPALENRLFKNRGPLSDFDSKILVATAVGVIPHYAANLLNSIKAVRNVFGHSMIDVSFKTKEISDEIERYILPFAEKSRRYLADDAESLEGMESFECRTAFLSSTMLIICMLEAANDDFNLNSVFSQIASL
jgi:hypothetical protein